MQNAHFCGRPRKLSRWIKKFSVLGKNENFNGLYLENGNPDFDSVFESEICVHTICKRVQLNFALQFSFNYARKGFPNRNRFEPAYRLYIRVLGECNNDNSFLFCTNLLSLTKSQYFLICFIINISKLVVK